MLHNKKAVSEMVGYVLLIVIAIGLSVLVYAYLKVFVPNDTLPNCPTDINIIFEKISCTVSPVDGPQINVTITNKGLFSVNAFYLRVGSNSKSKTAINDPKKDIAYSPGFFFNLSDAYRGLPPGESFVYSYGNSSQISPKIVYPISFLTAGTEYSLELQPALYVTSSKGKKTLAPCKDVIITDKMVCS